MTSPFVDDAPLVPLGGRLLRYVLTIELLEAGELSVSALVDRLAGKGFQVAGRPSKTVSDALRWEIGHGRVVRVGRGRYATGRIPRTTVAWIRRHVEALRSRLEPTASDPATGPVPAGSSLPELVPVRRLPPLRTAPLTTPPRTIQHRWRRERERRAEVR